MRTAGIALALIATAQFTLLSSPALADDAASASASVSLSGSASTSGSASSGSTEASASTGGDPAKAKTGWIVVGVGGAVTVGGIVLDVIGAGKGHVSGAGGLGDNGQTDNTRTDFFFLGTTLILAGVITGIYGGAMVFDATHGGDMKATPPPAEAGANDAVSSAAKAKLASAPSVTIPLVGATF